LRKSVTLPTMTLLAALCGAALPALAQDAQAPDRKRWWDDFGSNARPALGNPLLKGAYVSLSHVPTGAHRLYDRSVGVFDGAIPTHNFSWADGTWGAFEMALRLSALDLNDGALAGGRQRDLTAALNWTLHPRTRLMSCSPAARAAASRRS
jgi:hypothetical protein